MGERSEMFGFKEFEELDLPKTPDLIVPNFKSDREIYAIGDLHGNINTLVDSLDHLGLIDNERNWIRGNSKLIVLGDILADRNAQGIECVLLIRKIREQAQKIGGEVHMIMGNHDNTFITLLLRDYFKTPENKQCLIDGFSERKGMIDLYHLLTQYGFRFDGFTNTNEREVFELFINTFIQKRSEIFECLRQNNPEFVDEITRFKLCHREDSILFLHTDPTDNILDDLSSSRFDTEDINQLCSENLRGSIQSGSSFCEEFIRRKKIYTNVANRRTWKTGRLTPEVNEKNYELLSQNGLQTIIHGHTDHENLQVFKAPFGVQVISIDTSYKKEGDLNIRPITTPRFPTCHISTNGIITLGKEITV